MAIRWHQNGQNRDSHSHRYSCMNNEARIPIVCAPHLFAVCL